MKKWYPEFFYLLATLDYISRINNIPLCKEYNDIKQNKLKVVLYPCSIIAMSLAMQDESFKEKAMIFFIIASQPFLIFLLLKLKPYLLVLLF